MYARCGKRAADAMVAALLLVTLAPLMAATALVVLAALGRPVLFRQTRAGRGGVPFTLLKFRSMRQGEGSDAERLTAIGRVLRRFALDELPQLLNVLRGEMSLVGPRPLPLEYMTAYTPRQALRLSVRPGLAGLAQAAGRNALGWPERLDLDVRYAESRALLRRDAALLLRCVALALSGRGATAHGHATMPPLRNETSG